MALDYRNGVNGRMERVCEDFTDGVGWAWTLIRRRGWLSNVRRNVLFRRLFVGSDFLSYRQSYRQPERSTPRNQGARHTPACGLATYRTRLRRGSARPRP